ncbi:MAG: thioredoxin family protein [Methanomicrobiales archaeon]|nr:thioredoxin family protein [Methanomicrobiales archaeon]
MGIQIYWFTQEGCSGCEEQKTIIEEVAGHFGLPIREIDISYKPEYVRKYQLTMTPTILIVVHGQEKIRFEKIISSRDLEDAIWPYL